MQALSQTNTGDTCTIKWMFGVPEILETMRNMDIKEGSTIQVIQKCRDWLIIGSNNRRLAVGKQTGYRYKTMLNTRQLSEKSKEIELQKDPQRKTLNLISDCLKTHNVEYMLI